MNLGEVEAVKLPDGGAAIVSNIPSNVPTAFDAAEDGTVTHTQEILNTEIGKIVNGLHGSRVGGFSWACPGTDGGKGGVSRLSGFAGFDYVLSPGFAHNRELEDQLFESEARQADLLSEREALTKAMAETKAAHENTLAEKVSLEGNIKGILEALREALPVFVPDDAMHAMLNGDFHRAQAIFESAAHIDFGQYPLSMPGRREPAGLGTQNRKSRSSVRLPTARGCLGRSTNFEEKKPSISANNQYSASL